MNRVSKRWVRCLAQRGIMVFDDTRDILDVAHNAMEFFAEESCGKCFPVSDWDATINGTFVCTVATEFGSVDFKNWSGYEGDERVWAWDVLRPILRIACSVIFNN